MIAIAQSRQNTYQANQAFARIIISQVESGPVWERVLPPPQLVTESKVFNLVLAMPKPLNTLSVSGDNYHEFQNTEHGFESPFPTVSPGEKVEYANTYSQGSIQFFTTTPGVILNENFRFAGSSHLRCRVLGGVGRVVVEVFDDGDPLHRPSERPRHAQ